MAQLNPQIAAQAVGALGNAIDRLQQKGVRVILFTPPYYQVYNERYLAQAPEMIDQMYQSVSQLQQEFGVEYYDFSQDPELSTRPRLFINSDHVNECGRQASSERLAEAMRQVP